MEKGRKGRGRFAVFEHKSYSTTLLTIYIYLQKLKFNLKPSVLLLKETKLKGEK